ncbi:MAG: ABC transporter substrate-binding protein, partial [Oricola sp.]|nr:ABC transporter substrate-binding protein [Oricola sp.]
VEGTFNYAGAADPAIDAMIDAMLNARERDEFAAAVRALDRILISGHYVIPLYHIGESWVAHWARVKYPEYTPLYGYQLPVWWAEK